MSVFRPLNSSESNLFTIRLNVRWTTPPASGNVIVAGNSITTPVDLNCLETPSKNNIPPLFCIRIDDNSATNKFQIQFGKIFTSRPVIHAIPFSSGSDATAIPVPVVNYTSTSLSSNQTTLSSIPFHANLVWLNSDDGGYADASTFDGFSLLITGPVKIGVSTGNSNKGWSVSAGNDASDVYTFMNVGIGTGEPTNTLTLKGGLTLQPVVKTATDNFINTNESYVELSDSNAFVSFIDAPIPGQYIIITTTLQPSPGNHTVKLNDGTFDGTNNLATFTGQYSTLVLFGVSDTRYIIINNSGVTLNIQN